MKRLGVALLFSLLIGAASAQLGGGLMFPGPGTPHTSGGGGGCAQATSFLARTTYTGSDVTNFTNLICGMVSTSATEGGTLWARFDVLLIFATADSTNALVSLPNSTFSASLVSTPTFTADRGFTGNGSTTGITSNFNPGTATSPQYQQNSAHVSVWNLTNIIENTSIANDTPSTGTNIYPAFSGTDFYGRVNDTDGPYTIGADNRGLLLTTRASSSSRSGYQNGTSLGSVASTSLAVDSNFFFPLAPGSSRQNAMFSAGASLSATDEANFYGLLKTYMTAVGVCASMGGCP